MKLRVSGRGEEEGGGEGRGGGRGGGGGGGGGMGVVETVYTDKEREDI